MAPAFKGKAGGVKDLPLEQIIKVFLFALSFLIAMRFCSVYYKILFAAPNEPFKALGDTYHAINQMDPEFEKTEKSIFVKTDSYSIYGFNNISVCPEKDTSCVCLCKIPGCMDPEITSSNRQEYCKTIDYLIEDGFEIPPADGYRRYTLSLSKNDAGRFEVRLAAVVEDE